MKKPSMTASLAFLLVATTASAKTAAVKDAKETDRTPSSIRLDETCVVAIQNVVAAAAGSEQLNDESRKNIAVKNAHAVRNSVKDGAPPEATFRAHVDGLGFVGTMTVTATRGGCLVSHVDLDGSI